MNRLFLCVAMVIAIMESAAAQIQAYDPPKKCTMDAEEMRCTHAETGKLVYLGEYELTPSQIPRITGSGIYFLESGATYEGDFVNGLAHGQGKFWDSSGALVYSGRFRNGNRSDN